MNAFTNFELNAFTYFRHVYLPTMVYGAETYKRSKEKDESGRNENVNMDL